MLGRKNFTTDEIAAGRTMVERALQSYRAVTAAAGSAAEPALERFETEFAHDMVLALDRCYVHRLRGVTGKEGTPLNELELLTDALMNNAGVLRDISVIRYVPEKSVTQLRVGDSIRLTADDVERLANAVFEELEQKFA